MLTETLNEACDNVKFLSNLDKFLYPLYKGSPQSITDALPSLMSAMKMIHTLSRHYGKWLKSTCCLLIIAVNMKNYVHK